jgi:hypothetical protein
MGIKIQDVAYVRLSAPDLDEMEAFLTEFGMGSCGAVRRHALHARLGRKRSCT